MPMLICNHFHEILANIGKIATQALSITDLTGALAGRNLLSCWNVVTL